ncbi:ABC transporter ATP-binding protein [Amycolatopsis jejuensis]|uniref:ABC transporter ATP-binding protein n=1 Tax=Amycolatopsis jejuensis TaxID=330084 RepID=UPI0005252610|nr:ABC transporter ATP-binding protein [Amycolatopsis jejuensis]
MSAAGLLLRHLRPHRRAVARLALWSAVEALPMLVSGACIAAAIDKGFLAGRPWTGLGWLLLLGVAWVISAVATRRLYPWLGRIVEPSRDTLVEEVVSACLSRALAAERAATGAGAAQVTEHVEAVRQLLSTLLRNMRQVLASGVAAVVGLAVLSPVIAVVVLACVVPALAGFALVLRLLFRRYRRVLLTTERIAEQAEPAVSGIRDLVAQGAERRAAADIGAAVREQADALRAFARARVLRLPVLTLGVHVPILGLLALAPWLITSGRLGVGDIAGGVVYLSSGLQPAVQFVINAGSTLLVSLAVVLDRLAQVCAVPQPAPPPPGKRPAGTGIELDEVTFAYAEHADPVLRELTLSIPPHRHLAVVGPSGIGKSTLAALLAGLATPQCGRILLGGVPLDQVDRNWLRRTVALIPQEAYVFAGTVRENLCYLRPDAGHRALTEAVHAVGAQELVADLGGYEAPIAAGGDRLSPGQRQLLALARVYLSEAEVVVLDEATCHLDPAAEEQAEHAFARRPGTVVVIAHRISSARRAERILVLDGTSAALGDHAGLLVGNGLYARLAGHWGAGSRAVG